MAPEHMNKTCFGNHHQLSREYIVLDYSLRIEVPEYNGPFLKPTTCSLLEEVRKEINRFTIDLLSCKFEEK